MDGRGCPPSPRLGWMMVPSAGAGVVQRHLNRIWIIRVQGKPFAIDPCPVGLLLELGIPGNRMGRNTDLLP
jgi:hypothetical protein